MKIALLGAFFLLAITGTSYSQETKDVVSPRFDTGRSRGSKTVPVRFALPAGWTYVSHEFVKINAGGGHRAEISYDPASHAMVGALKIWGDSSTGNVGPFSFGRHSWLSLEVLVHLKSGAPPAYHPPPQGPPPAGGKKPAPGKSLIWDVVWRASIHYSDGTNVIDEGTEYRTHTSVNPQQMGIFFKTKESAMKDVVERMTPKLTEKWFGTKKKNGASFQRLSVSAISATLAER